MEEIGAEVRACTLCELARTRTLAVPGEGNVDADLMFVGEGPGGEEDRSGRPFVGASGKLLAKIITAMGFSRETVFITNIVKCRPPGNRDPLPAEVAACRPFLERQIDVVEPKVICALGLPATRTLLGASGPLGPLRGKKFLCRGRIVVPTYHPSYLLQNENAKALVWSDVQFVARLVAEQGGAIPHPEVLERAAGRQ
ncbi:MAG: uracil-DNA glycosylase [Planctomycetes bacterium]|nr:uracil-DNA glycosylase [Planctomycetota bacterium]